MTTGDIKRILKEFYNEGILSNYGEDSYGGELKIIIDSRRALWVPKEFKGKLELVYESDADMEASTIPFEIKDEQMFRTLILSFVGYPPS